MERQSEAFDEARTPWGLVPAVVFVAAAALRAALATAFPTIHGGDAAARLANAGTLVLGYQLPLPQAFVTLGRVLSDDPLTTRLIFCLWGAFLAAGVAALVLETQGVRAALFAGALLTFDPLLIHYSVVPYQEALAYGFVTWSLVASLRERPWLAASLMAAATLSRYEAWLFLPLLFLRSRHRAAAVAAAVPVIAWMAWWRGLAPSGLYVLDIDLAASRLPRLWFLAGKLREYATAIPFAVAVAGFVLLARARDRAGVAFVGWVMATIAVVIGFGHEFPPGSGLMSERLIHLPVLLTAGLASIALARVSRVGTPFALACVAAIGLLGARNLRFEVNLLRSAALEPDLALARDTARAIEAERRTGECVSVSAPRVDPLLLQAYVAKVGASFGDVAAANARAAALSDAAPDRDRIAAHLRAAPGTVHAAPGCPLSVTVDNVISPPPGRLLAEIRAGSRRARLYRSRD